MKKHLFRFLLFCSLMTLLLFHASAAETACDDCTLGTFNGSPACLKSGSLHLCENNFPDPYFRKCFDRYTIAPGDVLPLDFVNSCKEIDSSTYYICDLTGIEFFINLEVLDCSCNHITTLDLTKYTSLVKLDCYGCPLQELRITNLSKLSELICVQTKLEQLDLQGCSALVTLDCAESNLQQINLQDCVALEKLDCVDNDLSELNLQNCTALKRLECGKNKLQQLDLTSNLLLNTLDCDQNQLTSVNFSPDIRFSYINLGTQKLESIQILGPTVTLDFKQIFGAEYLDRICDISFDKSTGLATIPTDTVAVHNSIEFRYCIPTQHRTIYMHIHISAVCDHDFQYSDPFSYKQCSYCGAYMVNTYAHTTGGIIYLALAVFVFVPIGIYIYLDYRKKSR